MELMSNPSKNNLPTPASSLLQMVLPDSLRRTSQSWSPAPASGLRLFIHQTSGTD